MMRLIDADELEELFRETIGGIAKLPEMTGSLEHMVRASAMVVQMIQDAPTIEQPEVIRCKDCKYYYKGDCTYYKAWYQTKEDRYCSRAERVTK